MSTYKQYILPKATINDLTLTTVEGGIPQPGPGEVLVKVHAVSLNYRDLLIATGAYPIGVKENVVPCSDGAGEVVSVGEGVDNFKAGDRVAAIFNQLHIDGRSTDETAASSLGGALDGMLTQYKVVPQDGLVHIPSHLSFEEAATLPCAAVTAWNALYGSGQPLMPGQTVLLEGTGGVSIFGLQIAHAAGARTIITSSSDEKLAIAKKLGATHTINYKTNPDWDKEVLKLTNGEGVDHVVEVGGPGTLNKAINCLRRGGVISIIGFVAQGDEPKNIIGSLIFKEATLRGIYVGSRRQFSDLNKVFETHSIKPVIDKVFPFDQAKEAYQYLQSQKHVGKIVIKVQDE